MLYARTRKPEDQGKPSFFFFFFHFSFFIPRQLSKPACSSFSPKVQAGRLNMPYLKDDKLFFDRPCLPIVMS